MRMIVLSLLVKSYDRALWALRTGLDSWTGISHVAARMHRQGYDLQLTQYDERGWRATFYTTGMEHSPVSAIGTSWAWTFPAVARGGQGERQNRDCPGHGGLHRHADPPGRSSALNGWGMGVARVVKVEG